MNAVKRREEILNKIKYSINPITGSTLAKDFDVSRQVIVQDIAILRAKNNDIISTNKGYILNSKDKISRVFKVKHSDEEIMDELYSIVDLGGKIIDVYVWHKVYGKIVAVLNISSRHDVIKFMDTIKNGKSSPLKNTTSNYHYHTIEAQSEEILDLIEQALKEKKYYINE